MLRTREQLHERFDEGQLARVSSSAGISSTTLGDLDSTRRKVQAIGQGAYVLHDAVAWICGTNALEQSHVVEERRKARRGRHGLDEPPGCMAGEPALRGVAAERVRQHLGRLRVGVVVRVSLGLELGLEWRLSRAASLGARLLDDARDGRQRARRLRFGGSVCAPRSWLGGRLRG